MVGGTKDVLWSVQRTLALVTDCMCRSWSTWWLVVRLCGPAVSGQMLEFNTWHTGSAGEGSERCSCLAHKHLHDHVAAHLGLCPRGTAQVGWSTRKRLGLWFVCMQQPNAARYFGGLQALLCTGLHQIFCLAIKPDACTSCGWNFKPWCRNWHVCDTFTPGIREARQ